MLDNFIKQGKLSQQELRIVLRDLPDIKTQLKKALVYNGSPENRRGDVAWARSEDHYNTFNITQSHVVQQYSSSSLCVSERAEIQYVKYDTGGYFKWHRDNIPNRREDGKTRGITMTINLTDPSTYTGGELLLQYKDQVIELSKEQGSYIIFPAFLRHQACEVLSGTREALVVWTYLTKEEIEWLKNLDK